MASIRQPKKSETIEVRLTHADKTAFMEKCRADGATASDMIRLFIDSRIAPAPAEPIRRPAHWRTAAAIALGAALGLGAAAPSLAHVSENSRAAFDRLDRDHDGVLSYAEFRGR